MTGSDRAVLGQHAQAVFAKANPERGDLLDRVRSLLGSRRPAP